jgi:hypothetical protein
MICAHQGAHIVASNAVRASRRTDGHAPMLDDLRSYKTDTPDIGVPVFFAKPWAL